MKRILCIMALAAVGLANATINDTEPNNTRGTASVITRTPGLFSDIGVGTLTSNDVDFYSINLLSDEVLVATAAPLSTTFLNPDTEMGIFDAAGNLLAFDDDSGGGLGSLVQYQSHAAGTYYIGVTGTGDDTFTGAHSQTGNYQILVGVSPVPEPATIGLLGLGFTAIVRRRKASRRIR